MTAEPLAADAVPDELLATVKAATVQLAAANRLAAAALSWRDRLVLDAARSGRTLDAIAAAADVSPQMVGKLTRAAGIRRYRPREAPGA